MTQTKGYRVHAAGEPLDTLLDPARPDGWVAADETYETQPHGISACNSVHVLAAYVTGFLMSVQPDDRVVALDGRYGEAATPYESRIIVRSYEVVGMGRDLLDAMAVAKEYRSCRDWDEAVKETEVKDSPIVREWALEIWEG